VASNLLSDIPIPAPTRVCSPGRLPHSPAEHLVRCRSASLKHSSAGRMHLP